MLKGRCVSRQLTWPVARDFLVLVDCEAAGPVVAALEVAARPEADGRMIVVILADTGERYVTSELFAATQGSSA